MSINFLNQKPTNAPIDSIQPHPENVNQGDIDAIDQSIGANGFYGRILVQASTRNILAGKHRWLVARQKGATEIPIELIECDDALARRIVLADNRTNRLGHDDEAALTALLQEIAQESGGLEGTGYDEEFLSNLLADVDGREESTVDTEQARRSLAERFGVPPFTVLDARQGYWQERKRAWLAQGIHSELGRDEKLTFATSAQSPGIYNLRNQMRAERGSDPSWEDIIDEAKKRGLSLSNGTSIFDPVLCELAYRWFCPEGGAVLDPFTGGSVRGLVAAKLGRQYSGIDLRPEQVEANRQNWEEFAQSGEVANAPTWLCGDSREVLTTTDIANVDFVFSCPPYADLEKYSDDPNDLSNMSYGDFVAAYREIIELSIAKLKDNRFACFVVGDVREKKTGFYRNFVSDTIAAFEDAGAHLYNEAIYVTVVGSLAIRINAQFGKYRKLGKTHQQVLVFYKGDPKQITDILGNTEFGELGEAESVIESVIDTGAGAV